MNSRSLSPAILLSFLLHLMLGYLVFTKPPQEFSRPINLDFVASPKDSWSKWVRSESVDNNEIDPHSQLTGKKNQRTNKESVARADLAQPSSGQLTQPEIQVFGEGEIAQKKTWEKLSFKDLSVSRTGQGPSIDIKGVMQADRTILSTRTSLYHSYFERMQEAIEQFWPPLVYEAMNQLRRKKLKIHRESVTTRLLVKLDEEGFVQGVSVTSSSGVSEIDLAAVEIFQKAKQFPNPPKGLIEEDGFIRVERGFILSFTRPTLGIQWGPPGPGPSEY